MVRAALSDSLNLRLKLSMVAQQASYPRSAQQQSIKLGHSCRSCPLIRVLYPLIRLASPGAMAIAATGDTDMAKECSAASAREMKAVGINWSYSPVGDVNSMLFLEAYAPSEMVRSYAVL